MKLFCCGHAGYLLATVITEAYVQDARNSSRLDATGLLKRIAPRERMFPGVVEEITAVTLGVEMR